MLRLFEQYDEICKYFAEGKQKDDKANKVQKHLQLRDLGMGEYLTDKYALWLGFRMIDENSLHGMGRKIEMPQKESPCRLRRKQNQLEISMLTST